LKGRDIKHEQINMVLGTTDGTILVFDPILRSRHTFLKYNYNFEKKKAVDLVRWLDKPPSALASSRFIVVF
jgi:hypothetical protein